MSAQRASARDELAEDAVNKDEGPCCASACRGYGGTVKNITVSLDDESYRRARIVAAERDTSVSAMVRQFLARLVVEESDFDRLKRDDARLRESVHAFRAADRLGRDTLHERS